MNAMRSTALAFRPSLHMPLWCWLAACGVLLGGLDLAFAAGFWWLRSGVDPIRIPQSIAAWMLGRDAALSGGPATALLGLALYAHLTTAVVAAYYRLAERHVRLRERPVRMGALFGVTVYVVLFEVIVPLASAAASRSHPIEWTLACIAAYPLLVGIPAALLTRHRLGESPRAS